METTDKTPLTLLSLPYDIRFLIYQHLFPSSPQIYLQALPNQTITAILAEGTVATNILLTCRAIHSEAAGYLYNMYLFNLIGTKKDCLRSHSGFLQTLRTYAREDVQINVFSNGVHSETMCISLHTGDAKTSILKGRRRGVETTLSKIREEVGEQTGDLVSWGKSWTASVVFVFIASLLAVMAAYLLQLFISA